MRLNDLAPSLQDGHIRLNGSFRLRRPKAIKKNIDGTVALKMGLDWIGTGKVHGGGHTGGKLDVKELPEALRLIRRHSLIVVDDIAAFFRLTEQAEVSGGGANLAITPELPESPDNGAMVLLRWRTIGRVDGAVQTGNTLRIAGMTDGEDLIPAGSHLKVGGEVFTLKSDATIENGSATIVLTTSLGSMLEGGPDDGAKVSFFGGWDGRAVVAGADQTGTTLKVTDLTRLVPKGRTLSIDGLNGLFTVVKDTEITDNAAEFILSHSAVETLADLSDEVDTTELWGALGQPGDDTLVRLRTGSQEVLPRLIGDPDVELDSSVGAVLGFLIALFITIFTGGTGAVS